MSNNDNPEKTIKPTSRLTPINLKPRSKIQEKIKQDKMSSICKGKSSWPELVGETGETAKEIIEQENPLVRGIIVGPDSQVTDDFRCDRVWVWVDEQGKVTSVPTIG